MGSAAVGDGCVTKWTCCNERSNITLCSVNGRWSCCGKGISLGCQDITTTGKVWNCCNNSETSTGCGTVFDCCGKVDGCIDYYPCCDQGPKSKGCKLKCVNCRKDWGTGDGCVKTEN